jgi:hypothetical protein
MKNQTKFLPLVLFTLFSLLSCTNILFDNKLDSGSGLDFTYGTWLLNEVEIEGEGKPNENLNSVLSDGLNKMGIESIYYISSVRNIKNLPAEVPFSPDQLMLDSLKNSSGCDYLINVRTSSSESGSGGIAFGEQEFQNQAVVEIIVFDLNLGRKIHYQEIIATEVWPMNDEMEGTSSRFSFTRSSENLLKNALKRSLKELKKHSRI